MAEYYSKDTVQALACEICGDCDGNVDVCEFRDIKVDGLPATDRRLMEWIPVTERLPEMHDEEYPDTDGTPIRYRSSEPVLVWLGGGGDFMAIALYESDDDCTGWTLGGSFINSVTHWMRLPKPPEEAQE